MNKKLFLAVTAAAALNTGGAHALSYEFSGTLEIWSPSPSGGIPTEPTVSRQTRDLDPEGNLFGKLELADDLSSGTGIFGGDPIFGFDWSGTVVEVYSPNTYSVDLTTNENYDADLPLSKPSLDFTVGANQIGVLIDLDLSSFVTFNNVPVLLVADVNFNPDLSLDIAGTDADNDGIPGVSVITGPSTFHGQSANFFGKLVPVNPVPVPAAIWLLGSGLLGLLAMGRNKRAQ